MAISLDSPTMTATLAETPPQLTPRAASLVARAAALDWSQNELARRAKKDQGHLSRVFRGLLTAEPTFLAAEKALLREERRRARKRAA